MREAVALAGETARGEEAVSGTSDAPERRERSTRGCTGLTVRTGPARWLEIVFFASTSARTLLFFQVRNMSAGILELMVVGWVGRWRVEGETGPMPCLYPRFPAPRAPKSRSNAPVTMRNHARTNVLTYTYMCTVPPYAHRHLLAQWHRLSTAGTCAFTSPIRMLLLESVSPATRKTTGSMTIRPSTMMDQMASTMLTPTQTTSRLTNPASSWDGYALLALCLHLEPFPLLFSPCRNPTFASTFACTFASTFACTFASTFTTHLMYFRVYFHVYFGRD